MPMVLTHMLTTTMVLTHMLQSPMPQSHSNTTPTVVELFMLSRERPKLKLIQKPGTHTLDIPHMPTDTPDTHTPDTPDTTDTLTESKFSFYMGFRIWRNKGESNQPSNTSLKTNNNAYTDQPSNTSLKTNIN